MTAQYVLHGLHITSDVRLPEPEASFAGPADLVIRRGEPHPVERVPDDLVDIRFAFDDDHIYYEGFRDENGWCICAPELFTFTIDGASATARLSPDADQDLLPMLAAGMGISFFLALEGHLCLHASAVEASGRAVALCAPSGYGKSTLAALAAASGYLLIADDLLRVEMEAPVPAVYPGASEIRLRLGAATLVEHWPDHSRITADGRTAVAPPRTEREVLPLGALVFPLLDRERDDVAVEQLRPSEAFGPLLGCPRLLGWRYPPVVTRQFDQLTGLAARVPVVIARVPWRAPAEPAIGAAVIERVLDAI